MSSVRSHLYVPGDRPDVLAKAVGRGADALIVDLEDAVAPAAKDTARAAVARFLREQPAAGSTGPALWVRLNPGGAALADLEAVLAPSLAGVCLAKAESAGEVATVADALDRLERKRGVTPGSTAISPLLESAAAV
ncbi:MAG: aldolase/citrate lyase family protein, partial [Sciscionella sp.]